MHKKRQYGLSSEEKLEYEGLNRIVDAVGQKLPLYKIRFGSLPDRGEMERAYDQLYPEGDI